MTTPITHPAPALAPNPQRRPGWPKAIGITSLILGLLAFTCMGLGQGVNPLMAGMVGPRFWGDAPAPPIYTLTPALAVSIAVFLIPNFFLCLAGLATLRRAALGRTLHLAYALIAVVAAGGYLWSSGQIQAELLQWIKDHPGTVFATQQGPFLQQMSGFTSMLTAVTLAVGLAWPVFCIIWFGMVKRQADAMGRHLPKHVDIE